MIVEMDKAVASSSHDLAQRLYDKNIELENKRRKSAQARVPSDPNTWQQMRENFETIILEDYSFSEKHNIEFSLWQLHYKRIEEFRAHYSAASASASASATDSSTTSQTRAGPARPDRASKIRLQFKTFLSEATGFYHDLMLKIRSKYGLPIGQFYPEPENHKEKDGKKKKEIKKGLISCHRCLIYLGDLARYKGLYGEGESKSRDYAAASSYYLQAASLWPSSGNPHHQLAILATYSGDELMAVYRYFRSLAAENPFSTARDNLIVAFEKNRQSYAQLDVKGSTVGPKPKAKGKTTVTDNNSNVEKTNQIRQTLKAFRLRFVRLNGILFTRTSLETFEEILSQVTNTLQELLLLGSQEEPNFSTESIENGLFVIILVSILIFTVNNVKGNTEGQSYADIVQNTILLKNALLFFYEIITQLLKKCLELSDPSSSFLLPGILVCMEWIACCPDVVIRSETDEKRSTAQTNFWSHCISLFNKLLASGLVAFDGDEDTSCFTDMKKYEEGESENEPALWEDFELRGFLPLERAHTFLDFSRKHGNDSKKDKVARVKRILAAGKVIAEMITVDHKKVRFDSKNNKFVIGEIEVNGGIKENSKVQSENEEDEDDEVIVFRPNVIDNRSEIIASKGANQQVLNKDVENSHFEHVQNKEFGNSHIERVQNKEIGNSHFPAPVSVQNTEFHQQNAVYANPPPSLLPNNNFNPQQYHFQSPMWQAPVTSGLKGLTYQENGHFGKLAIEDANPHDVVAPTGPDPYIVARNTFSTLPTNSLKGSTNRPVRHLGPPPGFTSVRPKQLGQNPVNDDYGWLDGYQMQSSMKAAAFQPQGTSNFPFPGKQVHFEGENQRANPEQQQYNPPQQGQSIWKGNQFV